MSHLHKIIVTFPPENGTAVVAVKVVFNVRSLVKHGVAVFVAKVTLKVRFLVPDETVTVGVGDEFDRCTASRHFFLRCHFFVEC